MILQVMHDYPGARKMEIVPGMRRVEVRTGMSARGWGEDIDVSAETTPSERSLVTQVSSTHLNSVVFDFGRNRHNVNTILGHLIERAGGQRIPEGARVSD